MARSENTPRRLPDTTVPDRYFVQVKSALERSRNSGQPAGIIVDQSDIPDAVKITGGEVYTLKGVPSGEQIEVKVVGIKPGEKLGTLQMQLEFFENE